MTTLITGGTGLLGRHVISALHDRGESVRVLTLPTEDAAWLDQFGVTVYRGDIRQPDTLVEAMRGADRVLHLAALIGVWRSMEEYRAVNVTGTENVCREALNAGVQRLIFISSWTVYGMSSPRPATEDLPLTPMHEPYAVTKTEGESLVNRLIADEGLPAVIIRPGTFFGPGDRLHFGRIADRLRAGTWVTIGSGHNALPFVYVTDVVQGLLLALERKCAVGRAYNITNDEPLTQSETLSAIAQDIGARPPRLRMPYGPLFAAGHVAENIARITHSKKQPVVTRLGIALFGGDNRHSVDRARTELGYVPQVPLREGLRISAEWYRKQPPLR